MHRKPHRENVPFQSRRYGDSNFAAKDFIMVHVVTINRLVATLVNLHNGSVEATAKNAPLERE